MENIRTNSKDKLRIIWAIAYKDILDGLRNKTILSTLFSVFLIFIIFKVGPTLWYGNRLPRLVVYDAGNSDLIEKLGDSTAFDLRPEASQRDLEIYLGYEDFEMLGLVLPADIDQHIQNDKQIVLDGFFDHWVSDSAIAEIKTFYETQLGNLVGLPVILNIHNDNVFTHQDGGFPIRISIVITIALVLIGLSVTGYLVIEEKETKTLEVLMVSPASTGQVVIGKAVTGLFYCMVVVIAILVFNTKFIIHWEVLLPAVIIGALFSVASGLWLGSILNGKQQINMWVFILVQPLLIPVFLSIMRDLLPESFLMVIRWIPTVALTEALRLGFSNQAPLEVVGPALAYVAVSALLLFGLVAWVLRRSDR